MLNKMEKNKRQIKFRAWDEVDKKMVNITAFNFVDGNGKEVPSVIMVKYKDGKKFYEAMEMSILLLQFTGLEDKNGKEIYEGDIVELKDKSIVPHGEVRFFKGFIGVQLEVGTVLGLGFEKDSKVIGNIYENPDLLEKDKE